MKTPERICVFGKWMTIKYVDAIESDDGMLLGEYRPDKNEILIKKHQPHTELRKTVLHEVLHALICRSTLHQILDDKIEEAICCLVENLGDYVTWDFKSDAVEFTQI
jgi:hypothetical protein